MPDPGVWLISADVTGARDDRLALGPTCAISPAGEIVAEVPPGVVGMAVADIQG